MTELHERINSADALIDAVEYNLLHPEALSIPSKRARCAVRNGDCVKIAFAGGERLLAARVLVAEAIRKEGRDPRYIGILTDVAKGSPCYMGERIEFAPRHIFAIDRI